MHAFAWFLILYTGSALLGVFILWLWYDRRDRRTFEWSRRQRIYHCVKCGALYGVKRSPDGEGVSCPKCGYTNHELSY